MSTGCWAIGNGWDDYLTDSLTLPSCRSEMEQASMKAWAMTDRHASMWSVLSMSNTNWGFFRMFTQKRRGKLNRNNNTPN